MVSQLGRAQSTDTPELAQRYKFFSTVVGPPNYNARPGGINSLGHAALTDEFGPCGYYWDEVLFPFSKALPIVPGVIDKTIANDISDSGTSGFPVEEIVGQGLQHYPFGDRWQPIHWETDAGLPVEVTTNDQHWGAFNAVDVYTVGGTNTIKAVGWESVEEFGPRDPLVIIKSPSSVALLDLPKDDPGGYTFDEGEAKDINQFGIIVGWAKTATSDITVPVYWKPDILGNYGAAGPFRVGEGRFQPVLAGRRGRLRV